MLITFRTTITNVSEQVLDIFEKDSPTLRAHLRYIHRELLKNKERRGTLLILIEHYPEGKAVYDQQLEKGDTGTCNRYRRVLRKG